MTPPAGAFPQSRCAASFAGGNAFRWTGVTMVTQARQTLRRSVIAAILLISLLVFLGFLGGLYLFETENADRAAVQRVKQGMTYPQVVDLLGVMYDRSYPGEYASTDEVIASMGNGGSVSFVCRWRIGFSREVIYIGFDKNEAVVATTWRR